PLAAERSGDRGVALGSRIPGNRGPAVMVGHLDSDHGTAVFADLDDLALGDVIDVEGDDGRIVSFAVSSVTRHPKHAFPTDAVYGPTPTPSCT
ncbi:MAG TPA: sortase, partial [Jiangellaceae bacterium]|nr:sortase [Jiangellaceae bacterium]